jgi:predicted ester cyclase
LLAPDSVHHIVQAAFHPSPPGPEGYKERAARVLGAFPDYRVTIEDMIAEADRVVVRYTAAGKHLGPFQGVTPTGRPFVYQGIEIHRYTDGKVVERWNSHDALGLFQELGILPPLPQSPTRPENEPR